MRGEVRRLEQRRRRALREARRLARHLAKRHSVKRVGLVGSVLRPGEFRSGSDIDLIVWGLPLEKHISIWVEAEKRCGFPVDLIPWERSTPRLRRTFARDGRMIYDAAKI